MFKKAFIVALSVLTFTALTGCETEKKLTAEEAKTEIKAIQDNTISKVKETNSLKIDYEYKTNLSVNAKDLKEKNSSSDEKVSIKFSTKQSTNASLNADIKNLNANLTANEDSNASCSISSKILNFDFSTKGNAKTDGYLVKNDKSLDFYLKNETKTSSKAPKEYQAYFGNGEEVTDVEAYKYTYDLNSKNIFINDHIGMITNGYLLDMAQNYNLDTIITDWSNISKKGSTLIINFSNYDTLGFGFEGIGQLEQLGISFKMSGLKVDINKDNQITGVKFDVSANGNIDLSKVDLSDYDLPIDNVPFASTSMLSGYTGTINLDMSYSISAKIGYTSTVNTTVPTDLLNAEEESLEDLIEDHVDYMYMRDYVNKKRSEIAAKATAVYEAAETQLNKVKNLGVAIPSNLSYISVDISTMTYKVTAKKLADNGIIDNPFTTTSDDGGMTITYNQEDGFNVILADDVTIGDFNIYYYYGKFVARED